MPNEAARFQPGTTELSRNRRPAAIHVALDLVSFPSNLPEMTSDPCWILPTVHHREYRNFLFAFIIINRKRESLAQEPMVISICDFVHTGGNSKALDVGLQG